jgi:tRNA A-37 threonylcarbamoyl transferase component Bud32
MSQAKPISPEVGDRNLLFGILALQMDFVGQDALVAAMQAWAFDKRLSLGEILARQGGLSPERLLLLNALVDEHLKAHRNDPRESLAALPASAALGQVMHRLTDGIGPTRPARRSQPAEGEATLPVAPPGERPSAGGRYQVLRPYAKGGLGEVFVAEDLEVHREVALKVIQGAYADDAVSRGRFLLEAEVTGRLEHPGVVPVHGLGTDAQGRPFYAMRLVHGETLQGAIRRFHEADVPGRDPGERSLTLRQLLAGFVAVCNAVAYAHSRGVIHRDIKPSNIMLGKFGETVVLDWGLAKVVGRAERATADAEATLKPQSIDLEMTRAGTTVGTAAYMSPEQAAGHIDRQGPPSDVYSLGATLYALLTGGPPFDGADVPEMLRQVQAGAFPPPLQVKSGTAPPLDAVCRKAMALRPEDRYATALELGAEVERWLADEPIRAWREPWWVRWGRHARRRPVLALWLAVSAAAYSAVLASSLALPLLSADQRGVGLLAGALMLSLVGLGMSAGAQVAALAGASVGLVLGRVTASPGGRRAAGARGAARGAGVGLIVGAAIGYLGIWGYYLHTMAPLARALWTPSFISILLLGPLLGAGLGLWLGARKSARMWGGTLGGLAGAALAVILASTVATTLITVASDEPVRDPDWRRRADHAALARALVGLERHTDAVRAAREYARAFPDQSAVAYDAACYIARCVPLAKHDAKLSAEERERTGDEYGRLAVQQLREAIQAGYRDVQHIQADRDLHPLRGRRDFQDLMLELGAGP